MYKECGNNFCLVGHGKLAAALRGSRAKSEEILEGYPDFPSSSRDDGTFDEQDDNCEGQSSGISTCTHANTCSHKGWRVVSKK